MKHILTTLLFAGLAGVGTVGCRSTGPDRDDEPTPSGIRITVDPYCIRSIRGISELKRETYFGLCDHGTDFDRRCRSSQRYAELVKENGITFGRALGVVHGLDRWYQAIREDPARPGFADTAYLKDRLAARTRKPGEEFRRDMGGRLEVAAHDQPDAYPAFMGTYVSEQAGREAEPCRLPANIEAAAELAAATLRHRYTDFDRPAFFEPINEPHWSYWTDAHLAKWHLATRQAVQRDAPGVLVGGPCLSVAYFYRNQYAAFNGLKTFIANTGCGLDFYSFHVYDFFRERAGDFGGRITSGLPLESVLDLVQNHAVNAYGREIDLVVSEHGGYGADDLVEKLARANFKETGFDWEMKKRSIDDFNMISSVIANTLVFMDHPHTVRKAVPFILLEAMAWNPEYYAVLYVPRDYTDKTNWVPTQKILFYRLFRDLKGHRVAVNCPDPDIQARAFADGRTLFVILNNLSDQPETVTLDLPPPSDALIRRLGRRADFTPCLTEEPIGLRGPLVLRARETMVIKADYPRQLTPRRAIDEIPCYGDRVATAVTGEATFTVTVPRSRDLQSATLRIGISRPPEAGHDVTVMLNGRPLTVPLEDCAGRLVENEYATSKLIEVPPGLVRESNTIHIAFPDGQKGAVGAVVLRAGYPAPLPKSNHEP